MSVGTPLIVIVSLFMMYKYGTQSIVNPTAQQSLDNRGFLLFFIYSAIAIAVTLVSVQTKRIDLFFMMIAGLSLIWYIKGKSWQYSPQ
jgi:hypothetical protein